jgi:signal transduction histidine kinase
MTSWMCRGCGAGSCYYVTSIDLGALASIVALRYAEARGEHHDVTTDVSAAPLKVAGDAGRLEQILDNLLSNAIKYSPN